MAFAETQKLIVDLSLTGNFASKLNAGTKALSGFDAKLTNSQGRAFKAGQQIGTGIQNVVKLGLVGFGAISALLVKSVAEGQEAAKVQTVYATAIANSGKVSAAYVGILNDQQKALMDLGGVDDELIKTEQTRLIQMGLTGDQVAKLTPLILDFSKATGVDLLTATKLAGKSVEGNTGALSRYGVQVDKTKAKVDPFAATVDALNDKFGGTTKALSGDLNTRLGAFREQLANIREDAGQKLLPSLTRIVDVVGRDLVPAFGKLIEDVLPSVISGLDTLSDALSNGGAAKGIAGIKDAIGTITEGAKISGQVISTAVKAFLSLPPDIQRLAVAGLAVNKLTGGLVTNIAGGLISAVISQFKPLMNVQAGVVNVNGGISTGGVPGTAAAAGGGGIVAVAASAAALLLTDAALAKLAASNAAQAQTKADAFGVALPGGRVRGLQDIINEQRKHNGTLADDPGRGSSVMENYRLDELAAKGKRDTIDAEQDARESMHILAFQATSASESFKTIAASLHKTEAAILGERTAAQDPTKHEFKTAQRTFIEGHTNQKAVTIADIFSKRFVLEPSSKYYGDIHKQTSALSALQGLQRRFLAVGDTKSAARIGHDISLLRGVIARKKPAKVTVSVNNKLTTNLTVDGRKFNAATHRFQSVFNSGLGGFGPLD